VRHGFADRLDVGATLLGAGALVDAKVGLLPRDAPVALALSAGAGASAGSRDVVGFQYLLTCPISLLASVDLGSSFALYGVVGYLGFWIWGVDDPRLDGYQNTAPTGRGEGLLVTHVGTELRGTEGKALLFEYGRLTPLWHDPGHGYHPTTGHVFSVGYSF
jgi:hypothetical protein